MGGGSFKLVSDCGLGVYEMVIQGTQKSRFVVVAVVFLRLLFQLVSTVESRFFEPPRETEIGSKNRDFEKSKVA